MKKLILKNFQIHKKLIIDFDEGFNVILGDNDRGKSSIIRALNWIFYNTPAGDWMRRYDGKKYHTTTAKIIFKNGNIIKRIKGENENKYVVNGEEYENFGFDVPDPVKKILNIKKMKIGSVQILPHIAMQDDPLFLLYESSTVKASVINMLTGAEILQKAIKEFNKDKRNNDKRMRLNEEDIKNFEKEIEKLKFLDILGEKTQKIKKKFEKFQKLSKKYDFLVISLSLLQAHQKTIDRTIPDIKKIEKIILNLIEKRDLKQNLLRNLQILIENEKIVMQSKKEIKKLQDELQKFPDICSECGRPI